jgi:hypothetical protein
MFYVFLKKINLLKLINTMSTSQVALRKQDQSLTIEEIKQFAPAVFTDRPHPCTSSKYSFIPTSALLEPLRDMHYVPVEVRVRRTNKADHKGFETHALRFRSEKDVAAIPSATVQELIIFNSHDSTSSFKVMSGFFRVICSNGLVVPTNEGSNDNFKLRHVDLQLDAAIQLVCQAAEKSKKVFEAVDRFKSFNMTPVEINNFAAEAIKLRWPDKPNNDLIPHVIEPRRNEDVGNSLWKVFNRVQENLIKGIPGVIRENGRKIRVRPIKSIINDLDINKGLWNLAETFLANSSQYRN